jgi:hypothetical protein
VKEGEKFGRKRSGMIKTIGIRNAGNLIFKRSRSINKMVTLKKI